MESKVGESKKRLGLTVQSENGVKYKYVTQTVILHIVKLPSYLLLVFLAEQPSPLSSGLRVTL